MGQPEPHSKENFLQYWSNVWYQLVQETYWYIEDLSTKVPSISNTPWELKLDWKKMKGEDWLTLDLGLMLFNESPSRPLSDVGKWIRKDLRTQLDQVKERFWNTKFSKLYHSLGQTTCIWDILQIPDSWLPEIREWEGNFRRSPYRILSNLFRITFISTRPPKKTQRVRGYRDHGTESSVSDRARRSANISGWNEYLEEVLQYCLRTGDSPSHALLIFNMQRRE